MLALFTDEQKEKFEDMEKSWEKRGARNLKRRFSGKRKALD